MMVKWTFLECQNRIPEWRDLHFCIILNTSTWIYCTYQTLITVVVKQFIKYHVYQSDFGTDGKCIEYNCCMSDTASRITISIQAFINLS